MSGGLPFLPPSASNFAGEFNILFAALLAITGAVLGLVVLLMFRFCAHYRRTNPAADRGHQTRKSWHWEVGWTTASFVVFLGLYAWGADIFLREHHPPATAQDVVPGRYVTLWFNPDQIGAYRLYCSQFCGTDHAGMGGTVTVMTPGDFAQWLADNASDATLAGDGAALFHRVGCDGCHATGAGVAAPNLAGIYGRSVALRGGGSIVADEGFIRGAILEPAQHAAAGFAPVMPSFAGQLDEEQVVALVAYIKSLAAGGGPR